MIEYLQNKKYKIERVLGQGGFGITYKEKAIIKWYENIIVYIGIYTELFGFAC